jgi:hypothetical protein
VNDGFIFIIVALVGGVILLALISGGGRSKGRRASYHRGSGSHTVPHMDRTQVATRWATIEAMAAGGGNGLRQAVTEADKLLDHALRQQGLTGENMGARLKSAKPRFSDYAAYDATWRAHKLRNALAHEVGFDLVPSQAKEALADFHRALRELGAL